MAAKAYSKDYRKALDYAAKLHQKQRRKATAVPYVSHLLHVSALVWESGGSEEQAIAALLHDAVEDQGGPDTLAEIRERFGKKVARIVADCSDHDGEGPKAPWADRKLEYLEHLETVKPSSLLVAAADKVHNSETIITSLQDEGSATWDRFNASAEEIVWYYQRAWQVLGDRLGREHPLVKRLDRSVGLLAVWAAVPRSAARGPDSEVDG